MATWTNILRQAAKFGRDLLSAGSKPESESESESEPGPAPAAVARPSGSRNLPAAQRARAIAYAPNLDGAADPGEIVWAWVPFEENDGRGKDRPLLIVGRGEGALLGLMLSSRHERAGERDWVSIGTGAWDREGRESFVRLDRVLEMGEHDIRREGAVLGRDRFDRVAGELRARFGWT